MKNWKKKIFKKYNPGTGTFQDPAKKSGSATLLSNQAQAHEGDPKFLMEFTICCCCFVRAYASPEVLDLSKLLILAGRTCWILYVDILVLGDQTEPPQERIQILALVLLRISRIRI